jgi:hypothetical protein
MTEIAARSPRPHAYLVAGGGGGMRSTIILRLIAQELAERDIPVTPIDGITGYGSEQEVKYPSWQLADLQDHVRAQPERTPVLLIAHCIGTVAALGAAEQWESERPVGLVSIAPPLPSPRHTVATPQSQKKRSENDTRMRVVDLPEDALDYAVMTESTAQINPQYFEDLYRADDLELRLRAGVEAGRAAVFAAEYDWNVVSPQRIQSWHDDWRSMHTSETFEALQARAPIVSGAAHGLYLSPRTGSDVSQAANLHFQAANVTQLVNVGLDLLTVPEAFAASQQAA